MKTTFRVDFQSVQSLSLHEMRKAFYNELYHISFTIYHEFTLHFHEIHELSIRTLVTSISVGVEDVLHAIHAFLMASFPFALSSFILNIIVS